MEIKKIDLNKYENYKEMDTVERVNILVDFYQSLGWNKKDKLDPTKIFLSEEDNLKLIRIMTNDDKDLEKLGIKLLIMNKGPSTDKRLKKGKVTLLKGWISK